MGRAPPCPSPERGALGRGAGPVPGDNGVPFCCASHSPAPLLVPPAMGWNDKVARPRPRSSAQMLHENGGGGDVRQKRPCFWRRSLTKFPCFPHALTPPTHCLAVSEGTHPALSIPHWRSKASERYMTTSLRVRRLHPGIQHTGHAALRPGDPARNKVCGIMECSH